MLDFLRSDNVKSKNVLSLRFLLPQKFNPDMLAGNRNRKTPHGNRRPKQDNYSKLQVKRKAVTGNRKNRIFMAEKVFSKFAIFAVTGYLLIESISYARNHSGYQRLPVSRESYGPH